MDPFQHFIKKIFFSMEIGHTVGHTDYLFRVGSEWK